MNSKLITKIIECKNTALLRFISFFDNNRKYLRIILPMIIVSLSVWLTKIILDPINFEKEKNYRYAFIKEKLIDIRSAQLAYKEKNGQFTHNFEELIAFVKTDSFVLVQKTDTLIEYYNNMYREYQFKDTMLIDTLGKVSILDSLFTKSYPIDSLAYVPPVNKVEFVLRAGVVNKSKIDVPVFEAKDPQPYDKNKPLIIGSMTEANLNGNWQ
ncbi:MAG: hypothetical protein CMP54_01260 [Flavobacteriales bacterium]|nr:hypothetical protein [Flavobacteriales bacterium]